MDKDFGLGQESEGVAGQRAWPQAEVEEAMGREMLEFADPAAIGEQARKSWALFERLRSSPGDFSAWADLPSQEAFEDLSSQALAARMASGELSAREADPLPSGLARKAFCAPTVSAAGQGQAKAREPESFSPSRPILGARPGSTALAEWAIPLGIAEVARAVAAGEVGAQELAASFEARACALEPSVGALESMCAPPRGAPALGPLAGVPFVAKSLFWARGERSTASSAMLSRFVAPIDAPVVAGAKAAGGRLLALARMDELAMGGDGTRCAWGPTSHPAHPGMAPGGSSSGSAAALAAGMCMFSLGSDTGGSVRVPASHCGLWGIKPTYGALSRFGMVPYAFSLDCPGAFAKSAQDLALVYEAMASGPAGWDERQRLWDPRGWAGKVAAKAALASGPSAWAGLRVGVERSWVAGCDARARDAFARWEDEARSMGATIVEARLPSAGSAVWAYYLLACCEAQSSLARYDPVRMGWEAEAGTWPDWESAARAARMALLGEEPRLRALLGGMALSEPSRESLYAKACGLRRALSLEWAKAFSEADVVATPTCPGPPARLGQMAPPELEWAQDRLTIPASLGGVCALSAPWSVRGDGFEMGIQLCAPWHGEGALLSWAMAAEAAGMGSGPDRRDVASRLP